MKKQETRTRAGGKRSGSYHHGDLRNTLVLAGIEVLAEEGMHELSLRKLARVAGVSHNAPYMHFADKEALLAAIAEEGFRMMTAEVLQAMSVPGVDWEQRWRAGCKQYIDFNIKHPAHSEVMFKEYSKKKYPELFELSVGALDVLTQSIAEGQGRGLIVAGDPQQLASMIWCLCHGFSAILAGRRLPPVVMGESSAEDLIDDYLSYLLQGLRATG